MPLAWIPSNSRTCLRTYAHNAVARVFVMHHTYPMCRHARGNGVVRTSHWRASPRTCIEQPHPQWCRLATAIAPGDAHTYVRTASHLRTCVCACVVGDGAATTCTTDKEVSTIVMRPATAIKLHACRVAQTRHHFELEACALVNLRFDGCTVRPAVAHCHAGCAPERVSERAAKDRATGRKAWCNTRRARYDRHSL